MFQVPMGAPTASRMKIAPTAEATPPIPASSDATVVMTPIRPSGTRESSSGERCLSVPRPDGAAHPPQRMRRESALGGIVVPPTLEVRRGTRAQPGLPAAGPVLDHADDR